MWLEFLFREAGQKGVPSKNKMSLSNVLPITKGTEGICKSVHATPDYMDTLFGACRIRPTVCFKEILGI